MSNATGLKGEVMLPKCHEETVMLWWYKGAPWQSGLWFGQAFTFSVSVTHHGKGRLLVDRVESKQPLPPMNREDWTALCRALKETLGIETGKVIGAVTPDLFMSMKDGLVA